jgi:hypothetical protein
MTALRNHHRSGFRSQLLQKNKKPKIIGRAKLTDGTATISVKPASVLNQSVEVIYSGDPHFQKSEVTMRITSGFL